LPSGETSVRPWSRTERPRRPSRRWSGRWRCTPGAPTNASGWRAPISSRTGPTTPRRRSACSNRWTRQPPPACRPRGRPSDRGPYRAGTPSPHDPRRPDSRPCPQTREIGDTHAAPGSTSGAERPDPMPTKTAHAILIGGGVTGVSIAFHLAGLGVRRIEVLERKFLGAGGTGRSVGIVRQLYPTPETTRMVRASLDVFRNFGDAVGGQSGYVACGALIGVSSSMRTGLLAQVEEQRALGVKAQVLDPAHLGRIEPRIDASGLGAVLYEPESGYGDPAPVGPQAPPHRGGGGGGGSLRAGAGLRRPGRRDRGLCRRRAPPRRVHPA